MPDEDDTVSVGGSRSLSGEEVEGDQICINRDVKYGDAPLEIGITKGSEAVRIKSQTDDEPLGSFGNIYWETASGGAYASLVGSSYDDDIAFYTSTGEPGQDFLSNRFEIEAAVEQSQINTYDTASFRIEGQDPALVLRSAGSRSPVDTSVVWRDHTDRDRWALTLKGTNGNQMMFYDRIGKKETIEIHPDRVKFSNGLPTEYEKVDVRNQVPDVDGMVAYHDGRGSTAQGLAQNIDGDWISVIDGSDIS